MPDGSARSAAMPGRFGALRENYPVVIVGGGINGCGLFRDLCEQGLDVLLIERTDFCSGASAAPSRLIHGGIKYLETGEFRLVGQSARERNLLLKNAPHYVTALETVLPVASHFGGIVPSIKRFLGFKARMSDSGSIITRLGLLVYDLYGRHFRTMPKHRMLSARRARAEMPSLNPTFVGVGLYYEARISHAERLGLELVLDGEAANPASRGLNHAEIRLEAGRLEIMDRLTGERRAIEARIVVNAGGAWIDSVNAGLGIDSRHMGGTKGSHIIVRNRALHDALAGRMIYFGSSDGRVNLMYPFMGNVLIGATDLPISDPDGAHCSAEEIDYMTKVIREVFPEIAVGRDEIVMTYCGVRPLPRSEGLDPGEISRDHAIVEDTISGLNIPVLALIGGKWTTFRGFAEEAADRVLHRIGARRRRSTQHLAIGGGRDFPTAEAAFETQASDLCAKHGLDRETALRLLRRYGSRARQALEASTGWTPLISLPGYARQEIAWLCRAEKVGTLDDLVFRRTDIALSGCLTKKVAAELADIAAETLEWSPHGAAQNLRHVLETAEKHNISI